MDFALLRRGVGTIAHMIESKWITGRRDYHQEIFDDLLRLETANYSLEQGRWLIIAGEKAAMDELRATQINQGGGAARVDVFNGVLPFDGAHPQINVPVAESIAAKRILWGRAAQALGLDELPLTIMVKLAARGESGATNKNFECWIWQIQSVRNRATRPLELEA